MIAARVRRGNADSALAMKNKPPTNWLRQAVSDENNQADMAYITIGLLCLGAMAALAFVCTLAAIDYHTCNPNTTVIRGAQDVTAITSCRFDPLPIGQAAGLIFGAFAALIGALAGYMAATRRTTK